MNHSTTITATKALRSLVAGASNDEDGTAEDDQEDEDFLLEAIDAAKQHGTTAIRRVLRAVAVQALQQQIQIQRQQQRIRRYQIQQEQQQQGSMQSTNDNNNNAGSTTVANADDVENRIVITNDDIRAVQSFCRQLATKWMHANLTMGNRQVAIWIQQIVERENDFLYDRSSSLATTTNNNNGKSNNDDDDDDDDQDHHERDANEHDHVGETNAASEESSSKEQRKRETNFITPYAKLRSLRLQNPSSPSSAMSSSLPHPSNNYNNNTYNSIREVIDVIDSMGKRGQTYWIGSWRRIVQPAAAHIPYRLYKNNLPPHQVTILHASQLKDKKSNKNLDRKKNNDEEDDVEDDDPNQNNSKKRKQSTANKNIIIEKETTTTRKAVDWLISKKRKSTRKGRLPPKRAKSAREQLLLSSPLPRPASDQGGEQVWNMKTHVYSALTATEKKQLKSLVVRDGTKEPEDEDDDYKDDDDDNDDENHQQEEQESSSSSLILGSLLPFGRFHHYRQTLVDHADDDDDNDDDDNADFSQGLRFQQQDQRTPKQLRRAQRQSVKERLGDHKPFTTDYGIQAKRVAKSLMMQTVEPATQRHYREMDLNAVCMEVMDSQTAERWSLRFDTLQVFLLDEEDAPEGWHDDTADHDLDTMDD